MATVTRTHHELGKRRGATTLRQVFRFEGKRLSAARIGDILMTAPLTGVESIFGERPGREAERPSATTRVLNGFSPVAGFKFDVRLERRAEGVFLVHFSQPGRRVPLFVWRHCLDDRRAAQRRPIRRRDQYRACDGDCERTARRSSSVHPPLAVLSCRAQTSHERRYEQHCAVARR